MTGRPGQPTVDTRLAYDEAGAGEPAVVLMHGWGFGNPSHLTPQFEHLVSRHRVLRFDLPGHGRSARPPSGFGFQDCAAAVVAELEAAGVERAVLCGHSLGGRLALEVAAAYPSHAAGVVLLDPVILFPEPVRRQAVTGLVPALASENWAAALEAYFSRLLSPDDPVTLRPRVMMELAEVWPDMAAALMREGMETDGSETLMAVTCPLLMVGARAPVNVERLVALRPEAWVGRVVGSGHWLTLAATEQVNAMLDRFLASLGPGAAAT